VNRACHRRGFDLPSLRTTGWFTLALCQDRLELVSSTPAQVFTTKAITMAKNAACVQELLLSILGYDCLPVGHPSRCAKDLWEAALRDCGLGQELAQGCCLHSQIEKITQALEAPASESQQAELFAQAVACFRVFRTANACGIDVGCPENPFRSQVAEVRRHQHMMYVREHRPSAGVSGHQRVCVA
jgi:hypothetical protein